MDSEIGEDKAANIKQVLAEYGPHFIDDEDIRHDLLSIFAAIKPFMTSHIQLQAMCQLSRSLLSRLRFMMLQQGSGRPMPKFM